MRTTYFAVVLISTLIVTMLLFHDVRGEEQKKVYPIAIIGSGAAGTMATQRAVLNNTNTLLFSGAKRERRRSRGNWVRKVDNIPGFAGYERAILEMRHEVLEDLARGPMGHNLHVIDDSVHSIEKGRDFFTLYDGSHNAYYATYVILATGIMDEQPHIRGSIRPILKYANGQTVAYCAMCDGHRSFQKKAIVIGYSESAAQLALLLAERYQLQSMTILTNGHAREFSQELEQHICDRNIRVVEAPIEEVLGRRKGLTGFKLKTEEVVEADIGFISLGIRPNNQLALQLGANVDKDGLIITDADGESSVPNLFVIGDVRANSMKQIYTAWQHAVESVRAIHRRLPSRA